MLDIIVEAVGLTGLPKYCLKHTTRAFRTATYTVTISVDDKVMLTCDFPVKDIAQKESLLASDVNGENSKSDLERKFGCKIMKTSKVDIKVDCKHTRLYDVHEISAMEIKDIVNMLQLNSETNIALKYLSKRKKFLTGTLILRLSRVSTTAELAQFKLSAPPRKSLYTVADLEGLGVVSKILKSDAGLLCPEWVNLLGSIGYLLKLTKPISKIDPHAKLALSAVEVAFEIFMTQKEHDERVLSLVRVMADLYQMILDSSPMEKCQTLSQSINNLIALTRECAYFIAQYIKTVPFAQRMVANTLSNVDYLITQFEKQFFILKEVFFTGIMLSIGQVTIRVLEKLESIDDKLNEIMDRITLPVLGRSWNNLEVCLEGTQEPILYKIYEWGASCGNIFPNIFLLLGVSKLGKTAISHTVASFFHKHGHLGATIFFDSEHSSCRNFFTSIIRELISYDPAIHDKVMMGLKENPKFLNGHPNAQFDFLDSEVFKSLTIIGPMIIIVDGLDKCIDRKTWNLLKLLLKFPSNIQLLITSEPLDDILSIFTSETCMLHKMSSIEDNDQWGSLELYISGFFTILEQSRPNLFVCHSPQDITQEILLKTGEFNVLAQAVLEFIAVTEDNVSAKFLDEIFTLHIPKIELEAREQIRTCIISNIKLRSISDIEHLGKWEEPLEKSINRLLECQYIQVTNNCVNIQHYSSVLKFDQLYKLKHFHCTPTHCNASNVLQAVPTIMLIEHLPALYNECVSIAVQFILTCKCSYPPEVMKQENQSTLEYLLRSHQRNCIHKTRPDRLLDISWAPLQYHHKTLQSFKGKHHYLDAGLSLVFLSPPLQHSGLFASTEKITLLKIHYNVYVSSEAAIYRPTTEEGKDMLENMKITLRNSQRGIKPYNENPNIADIQVVKNPLTGKASWFVKNIPGKYCTGQSDDILWFNCPIPSGNSIKQFDNAVTEGKGIGFVNSLLPGDHIVIIAKSKDMYNTEFGVHITLYTDARRNVISLISGETRILDQNCNMSSSS
ncbi:hypothetical protein BDQ17DRAFT_689668 [Cyathus striatus]|nr:hypothetical protein BDQ17DRAFT_689668 [Cyathus striatus]